MKEGQDYIKDIAEIRSMMERSSKFLSLSGLAGVMAGIYALAGAFMAYKVFGFNPAEIGNENVAAATNVANVILLAIAVLVLAMGTAIVLSGRNARVRGEKPWNPTARRMLYHTGVPLVTGGVLVLILVSKGMVGLMMPFTLLFYGLAAYNASKFTYSELRSLGIIEIVLGLAGTYFVNYGLLLWAFGFGVLHIVYGIYMHFKYTK